MRWGLVGAGSHAIQKIVPALKAVQGSTLQGVLGSTREKTKAFAEQAGGVTAYSSLSDLLADPAIDAVFIVTPNDQHREQTERAAAAGKHVLVEKPMALTEADCAAMIGACDRAGVALGV